MTNTADSAKQISVNSYTRFVNATSFIEKYKSFLIVSHVQPDADSVGSSAALCRLLLRKDKTTTVLIPDRLPSKYLFLVENIPWHDTCSSTALSYESFDALIILDCSSWSRLGPLEPELKSTFSSILVIDHHATNEEFGSWSVIDPSAPATAFLVFHLITGGMKDKITAEEADALMAGLKADTGSFSYSNTSAPVFDVARQLMESGCDLNKINSQTGDRWDSNSIAFLRDSLANIKCHCNNQAVTLTVPYELFQKHKADRMTAAALIKFIRGFQNTSVAVLLYEDEPGVVKSSLRSTGSVDVSKIASAFGGGGHVCASGFSCNGALNEIHMKLINILEELFKRT